MNAEIELEIGPGREPSTYEVQVLRAVGGGEPKGTARLDLEQFLRWHRGLENTVLASAVRSRGAAPQAEAPLREAGQELFAALFHGTVGETYRASQAVARERGHALRMVLRLTAPELAVLPWEALFDPELRSYVCLQQPLVRHVPARYTPEPLEVTGPLRVLGLVAAPADLERLDVEVERRNLDAALAGPVADGRIRVEWLAQASWDSVQANLLSGRWHVLHFIGHGDYDADNDCGRLALVGDDGRADWVDAPRLASLLGLAEPSPRLVVLNSCSGGQGGTTDRLSGTAATLVHSGISAVVAMQFRITDRAAIAFPKGFYGALVAGRSVDNAVRAGRVSILGVPHSLEWVTPVLYLRGEASRLFTTKRIDQATYEEDRDYVAGLAALNERRWHDAVLRLTTARQRFPDEPAVAKALRTARRHDARWRRTLAKLGEGLRRHVMPVVATLAVLLALGGAYLVRDRPYEGPPAWEGQEQPSEAEEEVLDAVRTWFTEEGQCADTDTLTDGLQILAQDPPYTAVACTHPDDRTVVYYRFPSDDEAEDWFEQRLVGRDLVEQQGTLGHDEPWHVAVESPQARGRAFGRLTEAEDGTRADPVRSEIGWHVEGSSTFAYAFTSDEDFAGLYDWWAQQFGLTAA